MCKLFILLILFVFKFFFLNEIMELLKLTELRDRCVTLGLVKYGNKADLIKRVRERERFNETLNAGIYLQHIQKNEGITRSLFTIKNMLVCCSIAWILFVLILVGSQEKNKQDETQDNKFFSILKYPFNYIKKRIDQQDQRIEIMEKRQQQEFDSIKKQQTSFLASLSFIIDKYIIDKIEDMKKLIFNYDADKTGMADFASESMGASILFTRCTKPTKARWYSLYGIPITWYYIQPRVVIQGPIQPGICWSFEGSKGKLFIKLANFVTPSSFSIEHIPKEISLDGTIDSSPRDFSVYGYTSKDDISNESQLLLGKFQYDSSSKDTIQYFSAQKFFSNKAISVIELKIESNSGNKDYTCLYKFRVHGRLFKYDITQKLDAFD